MEYQVTVGLEVHAELRTNTKMFCRCKNDPDEKHPNINICPVCLGHPGTLPVINADAVRQVQRVGLTLNGDLQKFSQFDRKHYFYPDIPKGYQISQYKYPLVLGGILKNVKITRVHLEEDTARLIHATQNLKPETQDKVPSSGFQALSLVDFNRAGVPLMELVTEPDITSAKQAREFAEELQMVLQYLGASEANMEKGEMRVEANVSIRKAPHGKTLGVESPKTPSVEEGGASLGTKVEVKNLNSFRAVERAIEYEVKRQIEILENGGKVVQETRGWDENKEMTFAQRSKESAHDYRYFPEPDLPPMEFSNKQFEELKMTIPELPEQKRKRLTKEYKLEAGAVEILIKDRDLAAFWEKIVSELLGWMKPMNSDILKLASNYFISDLLGLIKEKQIPILELLIEPENFAELIKMIYQKEITSRVAKDVLRHMVEVGGDPSTIVEEKGLKQVNDSLTLEMTAKKIIDENLNAVADIKAGKDRALQFLVGKMMKETKGAANPEAIKQVLTNIIERL